MLRYRLLLPLSFLLLLGLPLAVLPGLKRAAPAQTVVQEQAERNAAAPSHKKGKTGESLPLPSLDTAPRDIFTGAERVVAVGDIHGDVNALQAILRLAKLIDAGGRWSGGTTHLVQTGDIPDRGDKTREALELLMRLEKEAAAAGGAVHALLGNHEVMNMTNDLRYVTPAERASYADLSTLKDAPGEALGSAGHRIAFSEGGRYGRWLRTHPAAIRIDETLFVHGGISPQVSARSLPELNRLVRQDLFANQSLGLGQDPQGPLWFRGYAVDAESLWDAGLTEVLKRHQARRMVMGHTVTGGKVKLRFGGRAVFIDTGMSAYYGGKLAALEIKNHTLIALYADSSEPLSTPTGPTAPVR